MVQSSALAVFNGDANRDFLNVQRVISCTAGLSTTTYRLTAYRTTPDTNPGSFVWTKDAWSECSSRNIVVGLLQGGGSANRAFYTGVRNESQTCPHNGFDSRSRLR